MGNMTVNTEGHTEPTEAALKYGAASVGSLDWVRNEVQNIVRMAREAAERQWASNDYEGPAPVVPYLWVRDVFPSTFILENEDTGTLYEYEWSVGDNRELVIGDPQPVVM